MGLGFTSIGYDLSRNILDYQIACPTFDNDASRGPDHKFVRWNGHSYPSN